MYATAEHIDFPVPVEIRTSSFLKVGNDGKNLWVTTTECFIHPKKEHSVCCALFEKHKTQN